MYYVCQLGLLIPLTHLVRYVPHDELMSIGPIGSVGPISAICPIDANWSNWFHGPNWRNMYYVCQLGQLLPRAQLVRYVLIN